MASVTITRVTFLKCSSYSFEKFSVTYTNVYMCVCVYTHTVLGETSAFQIGNLNYVNYACLFVKLPVVKHVTVTYKHSFLTVYNLNNYEMFVLCNQLIENSHKQYKSDVQSFTNMKLFSLDFQIEKYK